MDLQTESRDKVREIVRVLAIAASIVSLATWTGAAESDTTTGADVVPDAQDAPDAPDAQDAGAAQPARDGGEVQDAPAEVTLPEPPNAGTNPDWATFQRAAQEEQGAQKTSADPYQERREFRAARRQAYLERLRARADAPRQQLAQTPQSLPTQDVPPSQDLPQSPAISSRPTERVPGAVADLSISFQLDEPPRAGSRVADRWVPSISGARRGEFTLRARVEGRDANGQPVDISPEWMPADPATVEVSPAQGNAVTITVRGAGASNLTVAVPGLSKDLMISAELDQRNALQVEISQ